MREVTNTDFITIEYYFIYAFSSFLLHLVISQLLFMFLSFSSFLMTISHPPLPQSPGHFIPSLQWVREPTAPSESAFPWAPPPAHRLQSQHQQPHCQAQGRQASLGCSVTRLLLQLSQSHTISLSSLSLSVQHSFHFLFTDFSSFSLFCFFTTFLLFFRQFIIVETLAFLSIFFIRLHFTFFLMNRHFNDTFHFLFIYR
jgi:hypothetical protein